MTKYIRKTKDEYQLISNYGDGKFVELTEFTLKEIRLRRSEYRANWPNATFRVRKVRVKI